MRKTLRTIAVAAGIVSAVATILLGYIYVEDVFTHINTVKSKVQNRFIGRFEEDEEDFEI